MVLLVWPPPDHLWIGRKSRQFPPLSAPASIPAGILALGPSCVSPHAAARTRIVSVAGIRLHPGNPCALSKGYFAATFLSSSLTCPAMQSGLYQPTCRLDLNS